MSELAKILSFATEIDIGIGALYRATYPWQNGMSNDEVLAMDVAEIGRRQAEWLKAQRTN